MKSKGMKFWKVLKVPGGVNEGCSCMGIFLIYFEEIRRRFFILGPREFACGNP